MYARLFARTRWVKFHRALYELSLRGLGVMNYQDDFVSGERAFLQTVLAAHAAATVFDVGANVGGYAALVKTLGPQARVWAFEPHPVTFRSLTEAAARHGFTAINAGCGAQNAQAELFDFQGPEPTVHATLYPEALREFRGTETQSHRVRLIRLDSFCADAGITGIDLLKIDAEGHELAILEGAGAMLAEGRIARVQFEFNEHNAITRAFMRDFRNLMPGYELFRLLPDGLAPLGVYVPRQWEIFGFQNIVAMHAGAR